MGETATHRIFEGVMRICAVDNAKNYKMELNLLNGKKNRNNWVYENIEQHIDEFGDIPVLASYVDGRFGNSHDFVMKVDEDGREYPSFVDAESEHMWGWIPMTLNGDKNPHISSINGVDWVVAEALVPAFYTTEFLAEMERHGGEMRISIETLVSKSRMEGDTEYEEEYRVVGVTVLNVKEAVAGARIKKLSYSNDLREIKMRAASMVEGTKIIEPQTQNKNKENKKPMVRKQDLEKLLNGEYTVVGANENGTFALLNAANEPYICTATSDNGEVIVGAKTALNNVTAVFGNGEDSVNVDFGDVMRKLNAEIETVKKMNAELNAEKAKAEEKITAMENAENARRKDEVKKAIKARLDEDEMECDISLSESLCADMLCDDMLCDFAAMTDKEGNFCGVEMAQKEVDSRVMNAIREAGRAKAAERKNHYAWDNEIKGDGASLNEMDNAIANVMKINQKL